MNKEIIEKYSVFRKQSKVGALVFLFDSIRKNAVNFLFILVPTGFDLLVFIVVSLIFVFFMAIYAYIKYYYFEYSFDFERSEFLIKKGWLKKTKLSVPFEKIQQVNINQNIIHKVFSLYEIQMDTAGSKDTEVDIKAVSKKIAEDFKEISETIKKSISKNVDNNINDIKQEESLEIDLLTLVKTGLTSQYFETLGAMIALFFVGLGFLNDLEIDYAPAVVDFYDKTDFNVLAISIAIFIVIYIVLMVNLCLTLIKYYGYKALKKLQNLEVKYGLIQTKSILLSPIKVQEFRSTQNWIQKKINLRNVRISQASSMNVAAPNRRNIVDVPGCSNEQKDKLFDFIYDNKINDEIVVRPSIRKFLINFSLFALLPTIIFIVLHNNISFLDNAYFLNFTFIYFVVSSFAAWRFYRNSILFYSENFIRIQSGFWDIKTKTIENYKIQSVMLYQAFWHKRFNLGGIILLTAGGMSYITTCNYELLKKITNNVIYKVETSKKRWM
ncbi:MAG: hypothetical protein CMD10_00465 [Flavobacteriales bacterium]|nr:hypothetical protein [Flavobacteriales bacterium]